MKNLVSNWIFTLVEAILLGVFAVLMFFADELLNVLVGVAVIVYIALIVLSKVVNYRGIIQLIALLEFFVITVLAVFVIVDFVPFAKLDPVNFTVGVAMWFRGTTEILHSYHGQGEGRVQRKVFNAWKIFFYILLITFGTFIAATSFFQYTLVRYIIAGVSVGGTVIMCVLTYTNYRDYRETHPKPVKVKKPKAQPAVANAENENAVSDGKEAKNELPSNDKKSLPAKEVADTKALPEAKVKKDASERSVKDEAPKALPSANDKNVDEGDKKEDKDGQIYFAP